jgi:RNA recognition motif-containing protein
MGFSICYFGPKKNIAITKKKKKQVETAPTSKKGKTVGREGQRSTAPPNKILFITNLPPECTEEMLRVVFQP